MGKKTLAHPDYQVVQGMWHPTLNLGKVPADFTHKSNQRVWLVCPGCIHGCGRHHEWEARVADLTRSGDRMVCPYCSSNNIKFCPCRSVENDPRLYREWHTSNPPASKVAKSSDTKYLWNCLKGHPAYKASCGSRCSQNSGCPVCGAENRTRHLAVSDGRPDLANEWDHERNKKAPSEVTLGSTYKAWWICSSNPEHTWQAVVQSRTLRGTGCPACKSRNKFRPRKFGYDGG